MMFNSNDRVCFATYLGGTEVDYADEIRSIPSLSNSSVIIAGTTFSQSIQTVTCPGDYCYGANGTQNTFIMEFSFQGELIWSTYLNTPTCSGTFWDNALAMDPVTHDVAIGTYGHLCGIPIVGTGYHGIDPLTGLIGGMFHRFSGTDRSLNWSSYIGCTTNSEAHIRALAFDTDGNLYVGGNFVRDDPFVPLAGMYNQPDPYPNYNGGDFTWPGDPFVMRFAPGNVFDWGTFIGGYAIGSFWEQDGIYTMLGRNGELYVAGGHAKATGFESTYFALDEGNGIPYFSAVHNGGLQGFVASMCLELSIGIAIENPLQSHQLSAFFSEAGALTIRGLAPGQHVVQLLDASGRVCGSLNALASSEELRVYSIAPVVPGLYLLRLDGRSCIKVVKQ